MFYEDITLQNQVNLPLNGLGRLGVGALTNQAHSQPFQRSHPVKVEGDSQDRWPGSPNWCSSYFGKALVSPIDGKRVLPEPHIDGPSVAKPLEGQLRILAPKPPTSIFCSHEFPKGMIWEESDSTHSG